MTVTLTLTDDERVQLASAERGDVSYLRHAALDVTANVSAGTTQTITRVSGPGFAGVIAAGDFIQVLGVSANATQGAAYYKVLAATNDTITIDPSGGPALSGSETLVGLSIAPVIVDPAAPGAANLIVIARINLVEALDVDVGGAVRVDAGGRVYLGSETTINVQVVEAGDASTGEEARIKGGQSILCIG